MFDEFSSDLMQEGEYWRVHLGRRIYLHHSDLDGSLFIEELLEEIMHTPRPDRWETVKEDQTWITRPVLAAATLDANGDDNDLEYTSDGDLDLSDDEGAGLDDGVFGEDVKYDEAEAAEPDPLLVEDDYESDETDDESASELQFKCFHHSICCAS